MEDILTKLNLEALVAVFRRERIVPSIVQSMSDEELERLGVTAIGDRVRLRELCKEGQEDSSRSSFGSRSVHVANTSISRTGDVSLADAVLDERMRLFNPRGGRSQSKSRSKKHPYPRTWTVHFVCLADRYQCKIPSAVEKQTLHKAGLGLKKIKLLLDDDASAVYEKLVSSEKDDVGDVKGFPQLREAGGFEMLHCLPNCRDLTPLKCSWAAREIRSNLGGQSKIYLRPIQKDLSTKSLIPQNSCEVKEKCLACQKEFPMSELRTHSFYMCTVGFNSGSDSEGDNGTTSCILEGISTADSRSESSVSPVMSQAPQQIQEANPVIEVSNSPAPVHVPEEKEDNIDTAVGKVVTFCQTNNVHNPVEVLRCMQKEIVTGRRLELESDSEVLEGETNYINVDRMNILETAFEEIGALENLRLTLEVSFYGEKARDYGGPRREFFRLTLTAIKEKYFDNGIRDLLADDYYIVGVIIGLSIIQNGKIPQFFSEDQLVNIFNSIQSSAAYRNLQKGLDKLGICMVCKQLPFLVHIFRPSPAAKLTIKKLTNLLTPIFAEDGSNQRHFEGIVYRAFCRYLREVQSGRRKRVTLAHVLWFATGSDEEPLLGFKLHPSLLFTAAVQSFLPIANTCINAIILPSPTLEISIPPDEKLFDLYDCAFLNSYFGNV